MIWNKLSIRTSEFIFPVLCIIMLMAGCANPGEKTDAGPDVPRGYLPVIEIEQGDRILSFGPFVGYYFKPDTVNDLTQLQFICFNERGFYTSDLPENALLYKGDAILTRLSTSSADLSFEERIHPVFFDEAPPDWLDTRPQPEDEFIHFHSCHDATGPVLTGYWIRHNAQAAFTYDMGQRVTRVSPLYHKVRPGVDKLFARIIEFDRGPSIK